MTAGAALFRALLIASVGTGLAGSFLDLAFPSLIPPSINEAFEALPEIATPVLLGASALVVITFGGTVTAVVGLYFFQPWSRNLAVSMTVLTLLFYPLMGVVVQSGWAQLLLEISTTLWGVVLAMAFVSSLSARFESTRRVD